MGDSIRTSLALGDARRGRPLTAAHEILAGLLPKSVMHCCARSCTLQRTWPQKNNQNSRTWAPEYLATNQELVGDHVTVGRWSGGRAALTDSGDVGVNAL
jgi:hypothetical protein